MLNIKKFLPYKTRIIINKLFKRDIKLIEILNHGKKH